MITDVENIILNKDYFELTAEELNAVSDLVQNAEEFEEMKWFLASTQEMVMGESIEATPELKQRVMDHLNKDEKNRKFWLNSVGVFLFPSDKEFYRKPGFQMSLAAILLIGFLMIYDKPMDESGLALNETTIQQNDNAGDQIIADGEAEKEVSELVEIDDVISIDKITVTRDLANQQPAIKNIESEEDGLSLDMEIDAPQDGFYAGTISDADDVTLEDDKDMLSKSNANNNEPAPVVSLSSQTVDKDKEKDARNEFKKGDVRGSKDGNRTAKMKEENQITEPDQSVTTTNTGAATITPEGGVGVNSNGLSNNVNNPSNMGGTQEQKYISTEKPGDDNNAYKPAQESLDEISDKQQVLPYQLHVNDTKELKSLFKIFK